MLATANEVLAHARANRYAVPAFDCVEDVFVRAVLETAEACRSPVFLMCLEPDMAGNGWTYFSGLVRAVAQRHEVPIVLHLDHTTSLETIRRAIGLGFTSVMFDGSALPFDENARQTRLAVEIAHRHGVSVEAELGRVGGMDLEETQSTDNVLTDPGEVARFVELTEVDALAVSIGTSHGVYRSLPKLNIERLKELNAASRVPLVLHGGSGTPEDQVRQAVQHGICKMNIYADCRIAMRKGLERAVSGLRRPDPLPYEVFGPIREEIAKAVKEKIQLLSSENRV
ncbi:MAG: class II fructose-bisphosphate aldolase [Thermoguttaceae bacterium]|jgi:fructose-bisphosphate aldolase class II|nr:class II fructose-bisphosphate aldolase [Thermoguttaceae bacterium]